MHGLKWFLDKNRWLEMLDKNAWLEMVFIAKNKDLIVYKYSSKRFNNVA